MRWSKLIDDLADATSRVTVAAVSRRDTPVTAIPKLLRDRDNKVVGFRVEIRVEVARDDDARFWLQALETAEPTGLTQRRGVLDSDDGIGIWLETDVIVDTDATPRLPQRPEPVPGAWIAHVVDAMWQLWGPRWQLRGGANDLETVERTVGAKLVPTDDSWAPHRSELPEPQQKVAPVVALRNHLLTHPDADVAVMALDRDEPNRRPEPELGDDAGRRIAVIVLAKVEPDRKLHPDDVPAIVVYESDGKPKEFDQWAKEQTFGRVDRGFHILRRLS